MVAALRGRQQAIINRSRRELLLAYNSGAFAALASNGKLKRFDHYARKAEPRDDHGKMSEKEMLFNLYKMDALMRSLPRG